MGARKVLHGVSIGILAVFLAFSVGCTVAETPAPVTPTPKPAVTTPPAPAVEQTAPEAPAPVADPAPAPAAEPAPEPAAAPEADAPVEQTVYITNTGTKYHAAGCRFLKKSCIKTTLAEAKAQGMTACSVCNP